jgi:hypothetical protein
MKLAGGCPTNETYHSFLIGVPPSRFCSHRPGQPARILLGVPKP